MAVNDRDRVKQAIDQLPDEQIPIVEVFLQVMGSEEFVESKLERIFEYLRIELSGDDEAEAEWEERVLHEALGDAIQEDGTIDYSKVELVDVTLDELEAEIDDGEQDSP